MVVSTCMVNMSIRKSIMLSNQVKLTIGFLQCLDSRLTKNGSVALLNHLKDLELDVSAVSYTASPILMLAEQADVRLVKSPLYISSSIQFGPGVFFFLSRLLGFRRDIYLRQDKWGKLLTRFSLRCSPRTRL